ncbi:MAG: tRNA1(Val) (adenine(37)-N6)-methyltransferase [Candidatus Muiribacteriaceae bacterium]
MKSGQNTGREVFNGREYLFTQSDEYRFNMDSLLLGYFPELKKKEKIIDLGCGSGILCILMHARAEDSEITGIEIQRELADLAQKNVEDNGIRSIRIRNVDYCDRELLQESGRFSLVISNPPYLRKGSGISPASRISQRSRFEIDMDLKRLLKSVNTVISQNGRFCIIYRAERLPELVGELDKARLRVKSMRFVHTLKSEQARHVLVEAVKNPKSECKVSAPLIIEDENGGYTTEIKEMFGI